MITNKFKKFFKVLGFSIFSLTLVGSSSLLVVSCSTSSNDTPSTPTDPSNPTSPTNPSSNEVSTDSVQSILDATLKGTDGEKTFANDSLAIQAAQEIKLTEGLILDGEVTNKGNTIYITVKADENHVLKSNSKTSFNSVWTNSFINENGVGLNVKDSDTVYQLTEFGPSFIAEEDQKWKEINLTGNQSLIIQQFGYYTHEGTTYEGIPYKEGQIHRIPNFDWDLSTTKFSKNITSLSYMFAYLNYEIPYSFNKISQWDLSNITDMSYMFYAPSEHIDLKDHLNNWDVSNVTNTSYMFATVDQVGAFGVNANISNWNTSSLENMSHMFEYNMWFHSDLSSWDVSNVTNNENYDYYTSSDNFIKPNFE